MRPTSTPTALLAALALACAAPRTPETDPVRSAEVAELQGRLAAAAEWWQMALVDSGGQSTRAARGLARVLSLGGDDAGALRVLTSAVPPGGLSEVEDPWFLEDISKHYARLGAHDQALAALQIVAQTDPIRPSVAIRLGELLLRLDRPEEALDPLERAVTARPTHAPLLLTLAHTLVAVQRPEDALAEFEAAQALTPLTADDLRVAAGQVHRLSPGEAQVNWAQIVHGWFDLQTLDGAYSPFTLHSLGTLRLIAGDEEGARSILELAAELDPGEVPILTALGRAYVRCGQHEQAKGILAHAQQLELDETESADLAQLQVLIESAAAASEAAQRDTQDDK